jgi:hypothetical protein
MIWWIVGGAVVLLLVVSWFRVGGGPDGLHSGICSAAVLELPAPAPELVVRKEAAPWHWASCGTSPPRCSA